MKNTSVTNNACLNGLATVNLELTNRCNKKCWMCGRRKIEAENPGNMVFNKDMDIGLVERISAQLPSDIVVQFHNNGEPLMYQELPRALDFFKKQVRCFDTNGKLLVKRAADIIGRADTITVSTFERDEEWEEQFGILKEFLRLKGAASPRIMIRCLGELGEKRMALYRETGCLMVPRILHSPDGSFKYTKTTVIPEVGFCIEIMNHMAINTSGEVSLCVRFDPERHGVIGDASREPLADIWNSPKRREYIRAHIEGRRDTLPLCGKCHYWGVPRS
ncbi:MAG: hypothetical protein A2021_01510 [Elusimicrobia bacterium GWF2_52_66]|nr:MAG: hypothetical protein A2X33_02540 [Elusimicrobia bacterium GWA2_51_34]OGR86991.1 MAG: hypothetical protein A2021_01510 [Elusimicrobia bacterium GWF2_52_66]HAF96556.1 hypothetical protein [Elusimicrobiota bacterium]HCE98218.1 hypothetical protein [Elusimicrobiota bacterium]